ncbi:MAG: ferritin-like domain-containing protein [Acidobacteriia bacterium]|nr:ferritin-like domain-containing protein [Terriglobia bacterium]
MPQLKELLVEELQDLLHAETQLTAALPKMAQAASHPALKEAFEKHLLQTQNQVERLQKVFETLGEKAEPKPCRAMQGLIEEGKERIQETSGKEAPAADLALIAAAQKIEHYEIAAYGTARGLARQLGEFDCARLLSRTLGEEESADFLLTSISDPLVQQAALNERGANVNLDLPERSASYKKKSVRTEKVAG